jgi:nucleoside-diphosphate-sugar epimerase
MSDGRVLVTGASGFIGSHLAEALSAQGHSVRAFVRPTSDKRPLERLGLEIVEGDITDAGSVSNAIAGCERVFHAAAFTTRDRGTWRKYHAVNVEGSRAVGRAALHAGVDRVVYLSSASVYGTRTRGLVDEITPVAPDSHYGLSKREAERALLALHAEHGLPVVVARLSTVVGPGFRGWLGLCRAVSKGGFRMIGDGANRSHPCHIVDAVAALQRCGEVAGIEGETYNISADDPVEVREVVSMIAEEIGVNGTVGTIPRLPYRALRALDRLTYRAFEHEIGFIRRYDLFFRDRVYRNAKAKRELGFRPRGSIRDAVRDMVGWYREQGLLQRA